MSQKRDWITFVAGRQRIKGCPAINKTELKQRRKKQESADSLCFSGKQTSCIKQKKQERHCHGDVKKLSAHTTPLVLRKQSGAQIFTYVTRPNIMAGVSRETELCMQTQWLERNDDTADLFHVKQV